MPFMQAMAKRANAELTKEGLAALPPDTFAEPGSLVPALVRIGVVEEGSAEAQYLEDFPSGLKEAVRALLHDNLSADQPLDVTVAWMPGYDDEISLAQVANNVRSEGGITILVRSRYPGDRKGPGQPIAGPPLS
jgi:hypothetical protein